MQKPESIYRTRNSGTTFARSQYMRVLLAAALLHLPATAAPPGSGPPETSSQETIPWAEVGATAGAQYSGDGLTVTPTRDGARLTCLFQRMDGEATREGLWLSSTVTDQANDRFRVTAMAVGRAGRPSAAERSHGVTRPSQLPATGSVSIDGKTVRFTRRGFVEEYSVSMDGVRQDFVVLEPPLNSQPSTLTQSELRVELSVFGARVEPTAHGSQLILEESGRKIAYSRLKVTDATGRELPARMEAIGKSEIRNRSRHSGGRWRCPLSSVH